MVVVVGGVTSNKERWNSTPLKNSITPEDTEEAPSSNNQQQAVRGRGREGLGGRSWNGWEVKAMLTN